MLCKVAYKTGAGWFIYEDTLFASPERAVAYIESLNPEKVNKGKLFLVYPSPYGWTLKANQ